MGSRVRLVLEAPRDAAPEAVVTDARRGVSWRVALEREGGRWACELTLPAEPTILRYRFVLRDGQVVRERRQVEGTLRPVYGRWRSGDFQLAVHTRRAWPAWARDQVVYQIFPDRFARSGHRRPAGRDVYGNAAIMLRWTDRPEIPPLGRDFFGGDLEGIRQRLAYLADLGITCLYLTPVFASPSNHRYDAVDYERVDPLLGDEAELRALVRDARRYGIRVVLDGVLNHCSSDASYFRDAQRDRRSPTFRWFAFRRWPDRYVAWAGARYMPQFAETPEVEDFFFGPEGIARRWLATGIAGWRLDVAGSKSRAFWRRFAAAMRAERPDAYLVSEDWGDATDRLVGDTFDATMSYRFAYAVRGYAAGAIGPSELDDRLETLRRDTPAPAFASQLNLLTSHDTARLLTICGGDRARVRLAVALQLSYPGTPMIYYGEEAGLEGGDHPRGYAAEDGRRAFPWGAEDRETLAFFRRAIRARRSSAVLRRGDVETVRIDDRHGTYALLRTYRGRAVLAAFNAGERPARISAPAPGRAGPRRDLLGGAAASVARGRLVATLPPRSAAWFAT